jgi:hypothetical protein
MISTEDQLGSLSVGTNGVFDNSVTSLLYYNNNYMHRQTSISAMTLSLIGTYLYLIWRQWSLKPEITDGQFHKIMSFCRQYGHVSIGHCKDTIKTDWISMTCYYFFTVWTNLPKNFDALYKVFFAIQQTHFSQLRIFHICVCIGKWLVKYECKIAEIYIWSLKYFSANMGIRLAEDRTKDNTYLDVTTRYTMHWTVNIISQVQIGRFKNSEKVITGHADSVSFYCIFTMPYTYMSILSAEWHYFMKLPVSYFWF